MPQFPEIINPSELNYALETDNDDRDDQDWHLIELAAERWLEGASLTNICDCERSANGIGLSGRECDCPAGVRNSPQTSDPLLTECRDELERLIFNQAGKRTDDLIDRLNAAIFMTAPSSPRERSEHGTEDAGLDLGLIAELGASAGYSVDLGDGTEEQDDGK